MIAAGKISLVSSYRVLGCSYYSISRLASVVLHGENTSPRILSLIATIVRKKRVLPIVESLHPPPSKIAWIYLVLFVRIGTFQWVTANPNKKFFFVSGPPLNVSGSTHFRPSRAGPFPASGNGIARFSGFRNKGGGFSNSARSAHNWAPVQRRGLLRLTTGRDGRAHHAGGSRTPGGRDSHGRRRNLTPRRNGRSIEPGGEYLRRPV